MPPQLDLHVWPSDAWPLVAVGYSGYYGPDVETMGQPFPIPPERLAAHLLWIGASPSEVAEAVHKISKREPAAIHEVTPSPGYCAWLEGC